MKCSPEERDHSTWQSVAQRIAGRMSRMAANKRDSGYPSAEKPFDTLQSGHETGGSHGKSAEEPRRAPDTADMRPLIEEPRREDGIRPLFAVSTSPSASHSVREQVVLAARR